MLETDASAAAHPNPRAFAFPDLTALNGEPRLLDSRRDVNPSCTTRPAVQPFCNPHNPKVAGSNPAPATIRRLKAQVTDLGLRR